MKVLKVCLLIFFVSASSSLFGMSHQEMHSSYDVNQWEQANKLFLQNPHWSGADDAYSIKLDENRVLWLFGDTLISKNPLAPRIPDVGEPKMPRNTVGIQNGLNPLKSELKYYWKKSNNLDNPISFFESPYIAKNNWLWPGDGVLLPDGKTLVLFFMNIKPITSGLKFDIDGYQVAIVTNINKTPDKWNIKWVKNVSDYSKLQILIGSGGVITEGDYLYAYGFSNVYTFQGVYLARWKISEFLKETPNLSNPEWWLDKKWVKNSKLNSKIPSFVWEKGQTEFTVNKVHSAKHNKSFYLMTEAYPQDGFIGNADLTYRVSKSLTGPWSDMKTIYTKLFRDEKCPSDLMVYAGKYHPEQLGADMVFTYATNTQSLETLKKFDNIYYPQFIKLDKNKFIDNIAKSI